MAISFKDKIAYVNKFADKGDDKLQKVIKLSVNIDSPKLNLTDVQKDKIKASLQVAFDRIRKIQQGTTQATKKPMLNLNALAKQIKDKEGITFDQARIKAKKAFEAKKNGQLDAVKKVLQDFKNKVGKIDYKRATTKTDIKRDMERPALRAGKRKVTTDGYTTNAYGTFKNKIGKVYYESRANRMDVNQPSKRRYPKLAEGGKVGMETSIRFYGDNLKYIKHKNKTFQPIHFSEKLSRAKEYMEDELKSFNRNSEHIILPYENEKGKGYVIYREVKTYDDGGGVKGNFEVINFGGDRYDGGVSYEIKQNGKSVQKGLIDGDSGIDYKGKHYDGLLSLSKALNAKLVDASTYAKGGGVKNKIKYPIAYIDVLQSKPSSYTKVRKILEKYGIEIDNSKDFHTKGYAEELYGLNEKGQKIYTIHCDITDSSKPRELEKEIDDLANKILDVEVQYHTDSEYAKGGGVGRAKNFRKIEKIDYRGKDTNVTEEKWKVLVVPDAFLQKKKLKSVYFNVYAEDEKHAKAYAIYLYSKKYNAPQEHLSIEIAEAYSFLNRFQIKNQYAGKTAEEVWNAMDYYQRKHFLKDHQGVCEVTLDEINELYFLTWDELNASSMKNNVVQAFAEHIEQGQYAKGGKTKKFGYSIELVVKKDYGNEGGVIANFLGQGDAMISARALNESSPENYEYRVKESSKMAKGGMTEHGLKRGDTITDDMFWEDSIVVKNDKNSTRAKVNLNTGKRVEDKM